MLEGLLTSLVGIVIEFGSVKCLEVLCAGLCSVCVSCRVAFFLQFLFGMPGLCGDLAIARRILEPLRLQPCMVVFLHRSPILPADC